MKHPRFVLAPYISDRCTSEPLQEGLWVKDKELYFASKCQSFLFCHFVVKLQISNIRCTFSGLITVTDGYVQSFWLLSVIRKSPYNVSVLNKALILRNLQVMSIRAVVDLYYNLINALKNLYNNYPINLMGSYTTHSNNFLPFMTFSPSTTAASFWKIEQTQNIVFSYISLV